MKNHKHYRGQRAFSLLELIAALAIITILSTLSLPALFPREHYEAERVFRQLGAVLASARATAVSRHQSVIICPASSTQTCETHWNNGALVFIDHNQNGLLDQADAVIGDHAWGQDMSASPMRLAGTLHWRVFGNRQAIRISPLGEVVDQNGSLSWCPPADSQITPHQMVINSGGRIRLAIDTDGDGWREDSQGRPLVC